MQLVQLTQWRDRAGFSPNFQVLREPLHCIATRLTCQRQQWDWHYDELFAHLAIVQSMLLPAKSMTSLLEEAPIGIVRP